MAPTLFLTTAAVQMIFAAVREVRGARKPQFTMFYSITLEEE